MCGVALAAAAAPLAAQSAPTFQPARLATHIKTLSDDSFEGRAPASPGEKKTIDYLVAQMQAAGVQPGGDLVNGKRGWTQAVPLLMSQWSAAPTVSIQTTTGTLPLVQTEQVSVRAPLNGQTALNLSNAPLVFAGYGVSAPERGWDDFKGQDVRGKILVVLINDPDFETAQGAFGGKAMTYYGRWTYKYEEAARRGAAGVLIVHETAPASYGWNTVKNSNTNVMFDIVRKTPAADHPALEAWIQRDTAVQLFKAAGLDFEAAKRAAQRKDFVPMDLKARLTVSGTATAKVITSYNVAGLLPGKARPNETVVYSAHWDHLGVGQPDARGDTIYNGAVDNASGTALLLEEARAFARAPRTDRSLLFLFVTAEERGLLGSAYYANNPLYPLGTTVGVINADALNVWGRSRNFSMSGSAKLGLLDLLIEEAAKRGRRFEPDAHPEAGSFYRSDHFSMAKVGVPAISFDSGEDMVDGGSARGAVLAADYVDKAYHQPADEYSDRWDLRGLADDASLLYAVGRRLANSTMWPNWSEDSEFRATRNKSAAERPLEAAGKGERG
ncbi:M28 family peptidase [Sphingomonas piscis]|uniref:M28 family peptidase n=1 Tax=Sphingomonas piscis TaxID=2714943 RepID=A0A6G7YT18_9SPHN|nr:M28 family peptidase [Sphingomonas piscis]